MIVSSFQRSHDVVIMFASDRQTDRQTDRHQATGPQVFRCVFPAVKQHLVIHHVSAELVGL